MPATAGRVRMPANNRVHSSAALQTHGIWQSAIGYDPYAPDQKQAPSLAAPGGDRDAQISAPSADQQNAYDSFQGLLALARLTGSNADEARGACRKCGRVGHLPFQCRNFLVLKDEAALAAASAAAAAATSNLGSYADGGNGSSHRKDRTHGKNQREGAMPSSAVSDISSEEDESSETDDSGLSDSSEDSEMERAIVAKFGKNILNSLSKRNKSTRSKEQSRRKRSHSKRRSKGRKDISFNDTASSEEDLKKAKHKQKSSKRSHKEVEDSGTEEEASESEVEREHQRKKRRHSHKHSKSRSKHRSRHSDQAIEGSRKKRSKKEGSSRRHGERKLD